MSNHKNLCAAVIDGRAQTPRFKQRQLFELHDQLRQSKHDVVSAICDESKETQAEAEIQYLKTLDAVSILYASIDIVKQVSEEYRIARSENNTSRKAPFGYAYIVPTRYHLVYSTVVPIAAAITAGNCVCLELPQTCSKLEAILRSLLLRALDSETFLIAEKDPFEATFRRSHGIHLGGHLSQNDFHTDRHIRIPAARVVAVVDRSADLDKAAKEIVRARFCFAGRAPYAPDAVFVEESVLAKLAEKIVQATALRILPQTNSDVESHKVGSSPNTSLKRIQNDGTVDVLATGSHGSVVLIRSRSSNHLRSKIDEPVLILHAVSSMDDAIDHINMTSDQASELLSAAYFFAAPATAKYLGQFIRSRASFTNAIPIELLIGGPAPAGTLTSIHPRYTPELFSYARPDFVSSPGSDSRLAQAIDGGVLRTSSHMSKLEESFLKPRNEPAGGGLGFFEQGIAIGLFVALSSIGACTFVSAKYLVPLILQRMR